jgi:hypothetical protein
MNPLTLAYPIIAAALVWFGCHLAGVDTHTVDGVIFFGAVAAEIVLIVRGSRSK